LKNISIYTILLLLLLFGCSTKKDAFMNKGYHYTTARFNGYFHGTEAYKTAISNVANKHNDDYEAILEIYQHGDDKLNKAEYPQLNRAINKAAKMIDRHSMLFNKKGKSIEKNKMIDNCYLLIGKARLLKYDLELAAETFTFIKTTYNKSSIRYDASLWLIQTNIYQKNFVDAETEVQFLLADKEYPEKLKDELLLLQTQIFIKSDKYPSAIDSLTKAIDIIKKRKFKHRLKYILAQLYQKTGNAEKATELFKYVAKKSPDYDLQFNSKISLAKTFNGTGEEIVEIFEKMLKDEKNKEYQDQIYFALAQVYEKQNNTEKAIENYKLSAASSVNNLKQKGQAFLALGDYYFDIPEYLLASSYYDSSLIFLPKTYITYDNIKSKKISLTELVRHLNTVEREDSLQRIGRMSEDDKLAFTDELIRKVKLDKEIKEIEAEANRERALVKASVLGSNGESWIFDNPTMLSAGLAGFQEIWGDVRLEDNWRRSDKTSISFDNVQASNDALTSSLVPENQTVEFYLKGLPKTDEDFKKSDDKLKISYYQLGIIYRDNFNDFKQSNLYFELLNSRYPKNETKVEALYQLYRNYHKQNILKKKALNKNLIITEYPNSEYAQLLLNPNAVADKEKSIKASNENYEALYMKFKEGNYQEVVTSINALLPELKDNPLAARFELLKNFSEGSLYGKEKMEAQLRKTQSKYIGSSVANDIELILEKLTRKRNKLQKEKQDSLMNDKAFKLSKSESHYFVFIYQNKKTKGDELSKKISDFNKLFFDTKKLQIKNIAWSDQENALIVKPLLSEKEYYEYYTTFKNNFLENETSSGDLYFNISKTNYTKLFKYKEVVNYVDFFRKNYFASESKK